MQVVIRAASEADRDDVRHVHLQAFSDEENQLVSDIVAGARSLGLGGRRWGRGSRPFGAESAEGEGKPKLARLYHGAAGGVACRATARGGCALD